MMWTEVATPRHLV